MSPTLEIVLEQVKSLSESEQAELVRALSRPKAIRNGTEETRLAKIRAFRGRYRGILPSTEEFMAEKRKEVELEEQKWRR
jgi:hypothetical protein